MALMVYSLLGPLRKMSLELYINDLLEENSILRTYIAEIELNRDEWTEENLRALNERIDRYVLTLRGAPPEQLAVEKQRLLASQETVEELRRHIDTLTETVYRLKETRFENITKAQFQKLLTVRDTSLQEENKVLKLQLRDALRTISKLKTENAVSHQHLTLFAPLYLNSEQKETSTIFLSNSDLQTDPESFFAKGMPSSIRSSQGAAKE